MWDKRRVRQVENFTPQPWEELLPVAERLCRRYRIPYAEFDDAVQNALMQCYYRPWDGRGNELNYYIQQMKWAITGHLQGLLRHVTPANIDDVPESRLNYTEPAFSSLEVAIEQMKATLSPDERAILEALMEGKRVRPGELLTKLRARLMPLLREVYDGQVHEDRAAPFSGQGFLA